MRLDRVPPRTVQSRFPWEWMILSLLMFVWGMVMALAVMNSPRPTKPPVIVAPDTTSSPRAVPSLSPEDEKAREMWFRV
jgi:hypothetical protein